MDEELHEVPVAIGALVAGGVATWDLADDLGRQQAHFHADCTLAHVLVDNQSPVDVEITDTATTVKALTSRRVWLMDARRFQLRATGAVAAGQVKVLAAVRGCCRGRH